MRKLIWVSASVLFCLLLMPSAPPTLFSQDDGDLLAPPEITGAAVYIPFPVNITVDGDLRDWTGVPMQVVDRGPYTSGDPTDNGSFTFAVAADATNFYITMSMPDKNIIGGQHGREFWNEDSLEFYFNVSGDLGSRIYKDGIFQVNINAGDLGNSDPTALTLTGVRSDTLSVQGLVFSTPDGWAFEALVPLEALGITPTHGLEIGFQAQANGATVKDRDSKLIWSLADTGDISWQNPGVFGRGLFFEIGRTDIPHMSVLVEEDPTARNIVVDTALWQALVTATWEGYKANYIYCGENCANNVGLVFDPNMGYQAVSEGVGYGLLMAVMMNDQPTFDAIYDAAYNIMLDPATGLLHWRVDNQGIITGFTSATDAEVDIAAALIFAEKRVERGQWTQHTARPYGERAASLIDSIYTYEVADGRYLTPGDAWEGEGQEILNLSYFAPAWFRLFDDFQNTDRWTPVITYGYRSLFLTDGAALGLAPDWSTSSGEAAFDYCERTGRPLDACKYEMTYDAIRVPWRIALDCLWFNEFRACDWSRRSVEFLQSLPETSFARMYDMSGTSVVAYQNELMVGMWLTAALAANDTELQSRLADMLFGYGGNALSQGYWGGTSQYYFNQSLAWFGATLLSGDFRNLWAAE